MTTTDDGPAKKTHSQRAKRVNARGAQRRSRVISDKAAVKKVARDMGIRALPGEKAKRGPAPKHPWHLIRTEYIEGVPDPEGEGGVGYPTMDALATKWGVSKVYLRQRAGAEQWGKRREIAQATAASERRRARLKELAGISTDIDEKAVNLSRLGLNLVTARVAEIAKDAAARRVWVQRRDEILNRGGIPDATDKGPDTIDSRELEVLSRTATQWHALGRQALGDDVTHIEITGAGGGPLTTVNAHLLTDDEDRLVDVIAAMQRSGVIEEVLQSGRVVEGEVAQVEEDDDETAEKPAKALEAADSGDDAPEPATTSQIAAESDYDLDEEAIAQMAEDAANDAEYDIE